MLTEKDYCDYETCVALKELGYDELCDGYYHLTDNEEYNQLSFNWCYGRDFQNSLDRWRVGVPMLYEAQKFLREEKNIDVLIQLETKDIHLSSKYYSIYISYMSSFRREFSYISKNFDSYEDALSEGVKCAVKILKEK